MREFLKERWLGLDVDQNHIIRSPGKYESEHILIAWMHQTMEPGECEEITDPESGHCYDVFEITEDLIARAKNALPPAIFEKNEYVVGEKILIREDDQGFVSGMTLDAEEFRSYKKEAEDGLYSKAWLTDSYLLCYDTDGCCCSEWGDAAQSGEAWDGLPAWAPQLARLAMANKAEIVRGELSEIPGKGEYLAAIVIGNQAVAKKILDALPSDIAEIYRDEMNAWGSEPNYILIEMNGKTHEADCEVHTTLQAAEAALKEACMIGNPPRHDAPCI